MKNIKVIAFDADDTLFINETILTKPRKNSVVWWKIIFHIKDEKNCLR
jgi:FMN phosphatase YigB (HAD superfamily)